MRFEGRVKKDGRFWLVEIPAFDAVTQGRTKREAFEMAEDLIETREVAWIVNTPSSGASPRPCASRAT